MSSQKIKATALKLFTEKGYEGTSLANIADIVGIKKSSIYNHYTSKDDLFIHILENSVQDTISQIRDYLEQSANSPFKDFIKSLIKKVVSVFPEHFEAKFMFRCTCYPPNHLKSSIKVILDLYFQQLSDLFQESIIKHYALVDKNDLILIGLHFRTVIYGLYSGYLFKIALPSDELVDSFSSILTNLIEPKIATFATN